MSTWQKKPDFVDLRTGMHVIPLHDPVTGAEHKLQITVGHDSCPHCGHVRPKDNLDKIDAHQLTQAEIAALNQSHHNIREYAARHGATIRKAAK